WAGAGALSRAGRPGAGRSGRWNQAGPHDRLAGAAWRHVRGRRPENVGNRPGRVRPARCARAGDELMAQSDTASLRPWEQLPRNERVARDRLQPSLLDRLMDNDPSKRQETRESAMLTHAELRLAVL